MTTTKLAGQHEKAVAFRELHEQTAAFVIPNPWDAGSARLLQGMGFKALATTSSGFAYTLGRKDGQVSLDEKVAHCRALTDATDIPVSADLENGFCDDPDGVAAALLQVADAGVVGCSIEDYGPADQAIYAFDHAVERVASAVAAARTLGFPFTLTARAENLLRGVEDLDDTIRRLQAYSAVGADVLYAPGLKSLADIRSVAREVDRPLNVLASRLPHATVEELADAGARRISIGGALAYAAMSPILIAGAEMLESGTFGWLTGCAPGSKINRLMS